MKAKTKKATEKDVISAIRLLLGRDPESKAEVNSWLAKGLTEHQFVARLSHSHGFKLIADIDMQPPVRVDTEVTEEQLDQLFDHVERNWARLGQEDPHFSVVTWPQFRADCIGEHVDEFYDLGRQDLLGVKTTLSRCGVDMSRFKSALDYGCGVGRHTYWLAQWLDEAHGIDISKPHLDLAAGYLRENGVQGANLIHLQTLREKAAFPRVDFVFSVIVLQHSPPPVIKWVLSNLLDALNPSGCAYFQLLTYKSGYTFDIGAYLDQAPNQPVGHIEDHVVPQREVFQLIAERGGDLLEVIEDRKSIIDYSQRSNTFVVRKR